MTRSADLRSRPRRSRRSGRHAADGRPLTSGSDVPTQAQVPSQGRHGPGRTRRTRSGTAARLAAAVALLPVIVAVAASRNGTDGRDVAVVFETPARHSARPTTDRAVGDTPVTPGTRVSTPVSPTRVSTQAARPAAEAAGRRSSTTHSARPPGGADPTRASGPRKTATEQRASSPAGNATGRTSAGTRLSGVFVTAYSWWDNTPAGSSRVSHPVVHEAAGGIGTYADPITVAVGHSRNTGDDVLDHPAGTRFYMPHLQRYVIVEDTCGDGARPQDGPCHDLSEAPRGTTLWLDVWIGGSAGSPSAVSACAQRVTGSGGRDVVIDPPPGLPVRAGAIFDTGCDVP